MQQISNSRNRSLWVDSLLLLLIGVLFFVSHQIYCQNDLNMRIYQVFDRWGLNFIRSSCMSGIEVGSVRNWLPDGLWAFMLSLLIGRLWLDNLKHPLFIISLIILVSGYEMMQLAGVARGTFDILDLMISWLGGFLAWLVLILLRGWYCE